MANSSSATALQLVVHLVPRDGREAELRAAIAETVAAVVGEPGCLAYVAHESEARAGTVVMYESWADDAALDAHLAAPPFKALEARLASLLGEPLLIEKLRRIG
jgi:quinol monooxygenase YgiN